MGVVIRRWVWLETIGVVSGCFPHITYIPTALVSALFCSSIPTSFFILLYNYGYIIIDSVDSISRDELDVPLTQYITNA